MRRAGIFIGVNKYEDPEISKLDYAENDATELYAFFKHKYSYDIVLQLLSPDSRVLLQEVNRISEELSSGDLLLIYFAGHGMMHTGQQLLLFPKARYDEIEYYQDVIQLELLKKKTRRNGLNSVIILDTCRTQILHGIRGIDTAAMRDVHCMKGIVNAAEGEGAQGVLCSCDEGQQSREIARCRQGVFTLALLGVLQEAMEKGTKVSISDELSEALSEKLVAIGRDYEVQINQRPWFSRSGIIPAIYEPRADSMISQAPEDRKLDISTPCWL